MSVTLLPGLVAEVTTGGVPVIPIPANAAGGFITNPSTATGPLYVNPIDAATTDASGNTFAIWPGGNWNVIPGQNTPTSVNAADDGHEFSVTYWM